MVHGITYSKVLDTYDQCTRWISEVVHLANEEGGRTLNEIGALFFIQRDTRHVHVEERRWRSYISDSIGKRPFTSIAERHVDKWLDSQKRLSRSTIRSNFTVLRQCFEWARKAGFRSVDPSERCSVGKRGRDPKRKTGFLSRDEIQAVIDLPAEDWGGRSKHHKRRSFIITAIFTGLRKSELTRLTWDHCILDGDAPRVEVRGKMKSASAQRDVPLMPPAIDALREWQKSCGRSGKALVWPRVSKSTAGEILTPHGPTYRAGWFDKRERRNGVIKVTPGVRTKCGIDRPITIHDLRHTFCSHLIQGTWGHAFDLYEVRALAGHSDISVTQRYAHLSPDGPASKMRRLSF